MMEYANSIEANELEVITYLLHSDTRDLKKQLNKLSRIKWNTSNQKIYDLCKAYIKLGKVEFTVAEYISRQHPDKDYIKELVKDSEVSAFSTLVRLSLEELIKQQDDNQLYNELEKLKNLPASEVLKRLKTIKSVRAIEPLDLAEVKIQRLIDREYEKEAPSTGFKGLDGIIKGFVAGRTITMTGDTNVGKTQASCNFAYNVAKQGKKVLYFSLEPDITVIEYLASIWARKRFVDVSENDLTPPKGIGIDIYTKDHVNSLEDMVDIVENSERYDLIIIDHFGYFTTKGHNKTQTESNAMKVMAGLSKRNKCCVLIVVHPRKTSPTKKQKNLNIQDISGSAAFSQDATDVLIIVRKKDEDDPLNIKYTNDGYIAVHKTKAGANGATPIKFIEGSALIMEKDEYGKKEAKLF